MSEFIAIDGSLGEGGGQIVRVSLALAAVTGRPLNIKNIRARRAKPGLAAQHLTAVRAIAAICGAEIAGDSIGSMELRFVPGRAPAAGSYLFDVGDARIGGSAGATALIAQAILLPLALADGRSEAVLRGGTHVPWSPPFDYLRDVWLFVLARMGIEASLELAQFGFYPAGRGELRLAIAGIAPSISGGARRALRPLTATERGPIRRVFGRAIAANLPSHIAQRMSDRARAQLTGAGIENAITPLRVSAACPGAGLFLTLECGAIRAGFSELGKPGKPAEAVTDDAVAEVLAYRNAGAALDRHLADQVVLPAALASGVSDFTVEKVTRHLTTCAAVVEQFGLATVEIEGAEDAHGRVKITPTGAQ